MPINLCWDDNSRTIIRWEFDGYWGWDEAQTLAEDARQMMRTMPHTVHMILDFTNSGPLPLTGSAISNIWLITKLSPKNLGTIVMVGGGTFIRSLVDLFRRLYRNLGEHYTLADTLDEARALLARQPAMPHQDEQPLP